MNRRTILILLLAVQFPLITDVAIVRAQPSAPAYNGVVPAFPVPPTNLSFASEVRGRRLLFSAYDAVRNAPAFGFAAKVTVTALRGSRPKNIRPNTLAATGKAEVGAGRFALTTERAAGKGKYVTRALANPESVLVTRYEERGDGKTPPTREYSRLPLDSLTSPSQAFQAMNFNPESLAGDWLVHEDPLLLRYGIVYAENDATVVEYQRDADDRRGRETVRVRRYRMDPATKRVQRFEEWVQSRETKATGAKADDALVVVYRAEEYTEWNLAKSAFPATTYAQSLPDTYREKASARQPAPVVLPANADPKAVALLERWKTANNRWLTYSATVEQTIRQTPRTAESRPIPAEQQNMSVRFGVQARRYGKTRLTQNWLVGDSRGTPKNAVFISNGDELRATDQDRNRTSSTRLRSPDELWRALNRADLEDYDGLTWIYMDVPQPRRFTHFGYGGTAVTPDGEKVEILVLEYHDTATDRRSGRVLEIDLVTRVGIGEDGLPRVMEQNRKMSVNGGFERDNPPTSQVTTYYRNVRVDTEPAANAFVFPLQPSK